MNQVQWEDYARLQADLDTNDQVNDRSWGLEAALNAILDHHEKPGSAPNLETLIASVGRRERHRARLRRVNATSLEHSSDDRARLEARIQLSCISRALSPRDWRLACDVAAGNEYQAIAQMIGCSAGSLRIRMSRIRQDTKP